MEATTGERRPDAATALLLAQLWEQLPGHADAGSPLDLVARILDGMVDAVSVQDAPDHLLYANAAAAAFAGYPSPAALVTAPLDEVFTPIAMFDPAGRTVTFDDLPAARVFGGAPVAREIVRYRIRATGEERWAEVEAWPVRDREGRVVLAVNRFRDVTSERRAEESLRFLAEASAVLNDSLDYEAALRRIARLAVPRLADWCIVDVAAGMHAPRRLAVEHVDPSRAAWALEASRRFSLGPTGGGGMTRVLRTGAPALHARVTDEMLAAIAASPEHLALLRQADIRSAMLVPLTARGRVLGVVTFIRGAAAAPYDAVDLALAEDLARRAGLAVAHAVAHEDEARARELTAALARPMTRAEVAAVVLERVVPALGARRGAFTCLAADGSRLEVLGVTGDPDVALMTLREIDLDARTPMAEAARAGAPVVLETPEAVAERYPDLALEHEFAANRALVAVPLLLDGRVLGAIRLGFAEPRPLGDDDLDLLLALGRQVALALDRARLYDAERQAREHAELVARRQAVLAEASRLLAATLDDEAGLRQVAALTAPALADWCVIDLVDEDGTLRRGAVATADPALRPLADEARRLPTADPSDSEGIARVLRTGEPEFYPALTPEMLAGIPDPRLRNLVLRVGVIAAIIVPLVARGRTIGALTLANAASGRHFGDDDLATARNLADVAALAIDNGRLVRRAAESAARTAARARALRAIAEAQLDRQAVLGSIARSVSALTGDAVVVRLISADRRWLETVAVEHPVPEEREYLFALLTGTPQRVDEGLSARILATGQAAHVPAEREDEMLAQTRPEYRAYHDRYGSHGMFIAPLRVAGRPIGTLSVVRPASERPHTAEERSFVQDLADIAALAIENARLYTQAQDALRAREHFLSIASHELRTPLTAVKGQAQLLERFLARGPLDAERLAVATGRLSQAVHRLDLLVRDLVDVSRLQSGRLALRPETMDLAALAREVVARFAEGEGPDIARPHRFTVVAPGPVVGTWDPARLDQVLANLIGNAVKYSPGGGDVRVTVRTRGAAAELVVRDQGVGIHPEDQGRLFQPFERGSGADAFEGTGLGLYIARQITEQHAGELRFSSRPGRGSTFTLRLPRTLPARSDVGNAP